jgi:hypothetical protein
VSVQAAPAAVYRARHERFAAEAARLGGRSLAISVARFVTFAAFALCLVSILLHAASPGRVWPAGAAVALAAFLALLAVHSRVIRAERRARELAALQGEALARLARDWHALPLPRPPEGLAPPPLARDLGLLGPASLFHLLGTVHTPPGKSALAGWLLAPAAPEEIARRQAAVAELAPELELRQGLELGLRPMEKAPPDPETFLRWAEEGPGLLASRPWLPWLCRGLAAATVASGIAWLAPGSPVTFGVPLLFVLVNVALTWAYGERIHATFGRVEAREREFRLYAGGLAIVAGRRARSERLQGIAREVETDGTPAHRAMEILDHRIGLADVRHSAPLHLPLQLLLLWDFHVLDLLERWRRAFGARARRWLAALGDFEALAALAGLAHDEPGWAFPRVAAPAPGAPLEVAARDLGHPLLADAVRVGNDVTVGPPGTFLLVTGSNMSGKSTLLRAIGANVALAQAGGPVAAAAMSLPPLDLATSILVEDSLADGVSFFMAELLSVREVVRAADRARREGRTLLYLLDEILRGTNSAERRVAVERVLQHLLAAGAIGAVSTHDLELAEIPALAPACRTVHFRESFVETSDGPRMTFDYRLRPGVATTANALKLLDLVGLGEGES